MVEPARMFGCVMYGELAPDSAASFSPEGFKKRFLEVRVEIIHDQVDGSSFRT